MHDMEGSNKHAFDKGVFFSSLGGGMRILISAPNLDPKLENNIIILQFVESATTANVYQTWRLTEEDILDTQQVRSELSDDSLISFAVPSFHALGKGWIEEDDERIDLVDSFAMRVKVLIPS